MSIETSGYISAHQKCLEKQKRIINFIEKNALSKSPVNAFLHSAIIAAPLIILIFGTGITTTKGDLTVPNLAFFQSLLFYSFTQTFDSITLLGKAKTTGNFCYVLQIFKFLFSMFLIFLSFWSLFDIKTQNLVTLLNNGLWSLYISVFFFPLIHFGEGCMLVLSDILNISINKNSHYSLPPISSSSDVERGL